MAKSIKNIYIYTTLCLTFYHIIILWGCVCVCVSYDYCKQPCQNLSFFCLKENIAVFLKAHTGMITGV